jgi:hypothetical protein
MRTDEGAGANLLHTCLGTPTLGPALPVDVREPLGGILTLMRGQAQPTLAGGVEHVAGGGDDEMGCNGSCHDITTAVVGW